MTAAEAQERLVCILNNNQFTKADKKAMYLAINAINKRIPKKPIEKFAFSDDIEAGLCPLCNEGVNEEMNFCSYCGQAIDWEETDNAQT